MCQSPAQEHKVMKSVHDSSTPNKTIGLKKKEESSPSQCKRLSQAQLEDTVVTGTACSSFTIQRFSLSFLPTRCAVASRVALIILPVAFGNFFFKTSINPTLDRLLPWTSSLKLGQSSFGTSFLSLPLIAAGCGAFGAIGTSVGEKPGAFEVGAKNALTDFVGGADVDEPLLHRLPDFNAFRGNRGGSIFFTWDEAGFQYCVERGLIDLKFSSAVWLVFSVHGTVFRAHTENGVHPILHHRPYIIAILIFPAQTRRDRL